MMRVKSKKFGKQSYKLLLKESIDTGVPFSDQDFKAEDSAVFYDRKYLTDIGVSRITWKRPLELTRDPHLIYKEKVRQDCCFINCNQKLIMHLPMQLGNNIEIEVPVAVGPNQGLISAASAIARDKSMIYRVSLSSIIANQCVCMTC